MDRFPGLTPHDVDEMPMAMMDRIPYIVRDMDEYRRELQEKASRG